MYQKVQPYHLNKIAYLYLRQSTPQQLIDHQESLRVQSAKGGINWRS